MNYKDVLRYQPWLRLINKSNVSTRLLRSTKEDIFIAYNVIHDRYELHSVLSFRLTLNSCDAVIPEEFVNGFIVNDYAAHNLQKFADDEKDRRDYNNFLYDKLEENRLGFLSAKLKQVERTLGREI